MRAIFVKVRLDYDYRRDGVKDMENMSVEEKLRNYILENYLFTSDQSILENDDSFLEKGIIDSTGILEVIFFLEKEFGITVADNEMITENLDSVNNIVKYVQHKQSEK